jgi:transcriptional regulator with XRE-family HTH domain
MGCGVPSSPPPDPGRHWVDAFDGARLAERRQALGWSQVRLAEAMHRLDAAAPAETTAAARRLRTLVVQISCYESGRTRPRARAVRDLAAALGVDVLELLAPDAPVTLATLRARLGLTQADVAAAMPGMSRSLYAHVEQGRRGLAAAEERTLARLLAVDATRVRQALRRSAEVPQRVPATGSTLAASFGQRRGRPAPRRLDQPQDRLVGQVTSAIRPPGERRPERRITQPRQGGRQGE